MNLGILVSSHISYFERTRKLWKDDARIVHVVGGSESESRTGDKVSVRHNSFDFTGLIELLERPELMAMRSHVLTMHDTMEIGRCTLELAALADNGLDAVAADSGFCNLCVFSMPYLKSQSEFILSMKNCSKEKAIQYERHLWEQAPYRSQYRNNGSILLGLGVPFGDSLRRKEFYPSLDVVKWKANWGQTTDRWVTTP